MYANVTPTIVSKKCYKFPKHETTRFYVWQEFAHDQITWKYGKYIICMRKTYSQYFNQFNQLYIFNLKFENRNLCKEYRGSKEKKNKKLCKLKRKEMFSNHRTGPVLLSYDNNIIIIMFNCWLKNYFHRKLNWEFKYFPFYFVSKWTLYFIIFLSFSLLNRRSVEQKIYAVIYFYAIIEWVEFKTVVSFYGTSFCMHEYVLIETKIKKETKIRTVFVVHGTFNTSLYVHEYLI